MTPPQTLVFDAEEEQAQLGWSSFWVDGCGPYHSVTVLPRTCLDLPGALGRDRGEGGQLFGFVVRNQFMLHLSEQDSIFFLPQSHHLFIYLGG